MSKGRAYLDHAATTPVLPEVREAMAEALARWHNPSSPHAEGRAAKAALEDARARIATALGWSGKIVFTSGASEALAIALGRSNADRILVSAVEHDAVFRAAPRAERLPVDDKGIVLLRKQEPSCTTGLGSCFRRSTGGDSSSLETWLMLLHERHHRSFEVVRVPRLALSDPLRR